MGSMVVMKFGGSSVGSAESIARVAGIVLSQRHRDPVIVVSAMGKTTSKLLAAADAAAAGLPSAWKLVQDLQTYHRDEANGCIPDDALPCIDSTLDSYFGMLRIILKRIASEGTVTPRDADLVASFGELLASAIVSQALDETEGLDSAWVDCREVMITDDQFTRARPIYELTEPRLRETLIPILQQGCVPVLGGYVGSTADGVTTTLGFEGSDFSAAIVGAALGAEEVQIWTDVDGMLTADPRIVADARPIRSLSFAEALELSSSGLKKPHWGTLGPASRADVPIRILNSWHQGIRGTVIGRRDGETGIKSIAWKPGAHRLTVRGSGILRAVFDAVDRFRPELTVLLVEDAAVELSLDHADRLEEVRAALADAGEVEVQEGRAVVTLVSDDLAVSSELVGTVFAAARDWEPRLLVEGVAAPCIRCLVEETTAEQVVAELHRRLFA